MKRRRSSPKLASHLDLEPDYSGTLLDDVLEEFEFNDLPCERSTSPTPTVEERFLTRIVRGRP